MQRKTLFIVGLLALLLCVFSFDTNTSTAQDLQPPSTPQQGADGNLYMPRDSQTQKSSMLIPQSTGGPDDFGYIWDDTVAFNWIDATNGTDTGLGGYSCGQAVGPIPLPFSFDYYENSYAEIWINAGGYLAFSQSDSSDCAPYGKRFPEPGWPDDVIAPLWSRYQLADQGASNRVFYKSGGTAPNRYFVVEWYLAEYAYPPQGGSTIFTFEAILHENGNITLQYQTLYNGGGYYCDDIAIGIEDSRGANGLSYLDYCEKPYSNTAVLFTRPANAARLALLNPYQGSFTKGNKTLDYELTLVNNGTLGTDTYNLSHTSTWPLTFYDQTGTPLSDTNGDSVVDSGPVSQGETKEITVQVQTPTIINPTDENSFTVTATSTLDASKSKIATYQSSVPVPFALSVRSTEHGLGLYLAKPDEQQQIEITPSQPGFYMAIAETAGAGFAYSWRINDWLDGISIDEIKYTIFDEIGAQTHSVDKIADHSGATINTYDSDPTVAVAPNGDIGILWYRWFVNDAGLRNYNIYLAILDSNGNLTYGPTNLTNNNEWVSWAGLNVPRFYDPSIAATSDNRFVMIWTRFHYASSNSSVSDTYYAIRDTNGNEVKSITRLTNDTAGPEDGYSNPTVSTLTGNRVVLVVNRSGDSYEDTYFAILDSNGNVVRDLANISNDGATTVPIGRPDAVQFSDGNLAVAWSTWDSEIYFVVLDSGFNLIAGPTALSHPAMRVRDWGPRTNFSLAADTAGHVVITWMDSDSNNSRNLYYTLINSIGVVETSPMIFLSSPRQILTGAQGYSNTSYTFEPTTPGVDSYMQAPQNLMGAPNGSVIIPLDFGNMGASAATSVTITATLSSALTYLGDTSGITPAHNSPIANQVTATENTTYAWEFSSAMNFLGNGQFDLFVGMGDVQVGDSYPVTVTIYAAESDGNINDNTITIDVVAAQQVFLPLVVR